MDITLPTAVLESQFYQENFEIPEPQAVVHYVWKLTGQLRDP